MISLPFTISAVILLIAFFVSKIQYAATCLGIAAHAFFGILQTASLIYTFILCIQNNSNGLDIIIILAVAIGLIFVLNFLSFVSQTGLLSQDPKFLKWLRRRQNRFDMKYNLFWFYFISVISLLTNFKFKMVLFSKLFNFDCFKCQLQRVEQFKWFNIFSFLALIPQILVLYCLFITIFQFQRDDQLFSSVIDTIIIYLTSIVCSFVAAYKQSNFFNEQLNGVPINKIFNVGEQSFQSSVKIGGEVAIGYSLDDIVQVNQMAYLTTLRECTKNSKQEIKESKNQSQSQNNTDTGINKIESDSSEKQNMQIMECPQNNRQFSNILIIDEHFAIDSEISQQIDNQNSTQIKQVKSEDPLVEIHRHKQLLKQPLKKQIFNQVQQQNISQNQRVNLADYLIRLQRREQFVPKYDKYNIQSDLTNRKSIEFNDNLPEQTKLQKLLSHQIKQAKNINKASSQFQQQQPYFPDNESRMNFKSQPPVRNKYQKQSKFKLNQLKTPIFKNMIQIIQKKHHSITKTAFRQLTPNPLQTHTFQRQYHINEDHAEKPVVNKNKQKIKQITNNPIGTNNFRTIGQKYLDQEQFQRQQNREQRTQANRQHLKIQQNSHNKIQVVQGYVEDTKQSAIMSSNGNQDNFYMQFVKEQFTENDCKQFKRSTPLNFTLFPQKHKEYINQLQQSFSNQSPRKPSSLITLQKFRTKFKSKQFIKDLFSSKRSSDLYNRNKSCESRITMMTQGEYRRKRSQKLQSSYSEDRSKQLTLQKIYLQKMVK